jgi:hypothetical protein
MSDPTAFPPPPDATPGPPPPPPGFGTPPPTYGQPTPPPPYGQPAHGQPAYGQPTYGQPAYGQPPMNTPIPGYVPYGQQSSEPAARPKSPVGSILIMLGGALLIVCAWLPWFTLNSESANGWDTFASTSDDGVRVFESPGKIFVVTGIVVLIFGIIAYVVGKQLALAIVTLVVTVIAFFVSLLGLGVAANQREFLDDEGNIGIGVVLGFLSMLVAVAGAIVVLAKRRRTVVYNS